MKIILATVASVLLVGVAFAYPYPISDVYNEDEPRLVQFVPLRRISRKVVPPMQERVLVPRSIDDERDLISVASSNDPVAAETGYGHSHHPYDYVDYGAYTGGYGAFGWYSDHPVYTQHGY